MPEGDTIAYAARRLRPILLGQVPELQARHGSLRGWEERLAGREVTAIDTYGKHLFLRFDGDLTIHSHLRMTGAWHTGPIGKPWRRAPRRAWLVMRARGQEAVQFDGPLLELMTGLRSAGIPASRSSAPTSSARYLTSRTTCGACARTIPRGHLAMRSSISGSSPAWEISGVRRRALTLA